MDETRNVIKEGYVREIVLHEVGILMLDPDADTMLTKGYVVGEREMNAELLAKLVYYLHNGTLAEDWDVERLRKWFAFNPKEDSFTAKLMWSVDPEPISADMETTYKIWAAVEPTGVTVVITWINTESLEPVSEWEIFHAGRYSIIWKEI